jgi:hypothetical protein
MMPWRWKVGLIEALTHKILHQAFSLKLSPNFHRHRLIEELEVEFDLTDRAGVQSDGMDKGEEKRKLNTKMDGVQRMALTE